MKPQCATCWYWDRLEGENRGLCRVSPPKARMLAEVDTPVSVGSFNNTAWPVTGIRDWCSAHALEEEIR